MQVPRSHPLTEPDEAKVDTTLNVYAQVVDGSLRRAAETVGSELFTIVHEPEGATDYRALPQRFQSHLLMPAAARRCRELLPWNGRKMAAFSRHS